MNETTKSIIRVVFGAALAATLVLFFVSNQTSLRDSRETVTRLQDENRELTLRLGDIQVAVDEVADGLGGAASTAGDVADGLEGVISGLDDIDRVLVELFDFLGRVEEILGIGSPSPEPDSP